MDGVNLFEELRDSIPFDKESVLKNLSLQLFDTKTPEDVFKIYESLDDPYAEELCLIVKFLQYNMHQTYEDPRVIEVIEKLMEKYNDLDFDYRIEALFSIGDLVCSNGLEIESKHHEQIVRSFDEVQVPPERLSDLPQIAFMLTTLNEAGPVLPAVVEQLSSTYLVMKRESLNLATINTLLLAWSNSTCLNTDFLDIISKKIIELHDASQFFERG
jgi:hypothetical protein